MVLNVRRGNNIDTLEFKVREEELKSYKRRILKNSNINELFYTLSTNEHDVVSKITIATEIRSDEHLRKIDITHLDSLKNYLVSHEYTGLFDRSYKVHGILYEAHTNSSLHCSGCDMREGQKKILESYLNGEYNNLIPFEVYKFNPKAPLHPTILHRFISPNKFYEYEFMSEPYKRLENMIDLPYKLYLLQLLLLGRFNELLKLNENIREQLQLFNISCIKSENINQERKKYPWLKNYDTYLDHCVEEAEVGKSFCKKNNIYRSF